MKRHVAWLTTKQAADHLGFTSVHAFTVWLGRERAKGNPKLKVHWLGQRMRFREVDLDALVEAEPQVTSPLRLATGR